MLRSRVMRGRRVMGTIAAGVASASALWTLAGSESAMGAAPVCTFTVLTPPLERIPCTAGPAIEVDGGTVLQISAGPSDAGTTFRVVEHFRAPPKTGDQGRNSHTLIAVRRGGGEWSAMVGPVFPPRAPFSSKLTAVGSPVTKTTTSNTAYRTFELHGTISALLSPSPSSPPTASPLDVRFDF